MAKIIKRSGDDDAAHRSPARSPAAGGVIKRDVYDASTEAERILAEAQEEGQEIVARAEREATRIREKAREDGRVEARAEANALLVKARIERERLLGETEPQLVALARGVAEKIIGRELEVRDDTIVAIVRQAIQTVRQQREIIVRVNPQDLEALQKGKHEIIAVLARAKDVDLRGDPSISRGGCVVESELGTIDAELETQLDVIERLLAGEGRARE